jgi:hypothetical protein
MAGLVIGLLLAGGPVLAEDGHRSREQREARARTACAAGRVDEGVEMLARLLTEFRHPNYIFNQARCYQQNGLLEQALTRFQEYLRVATEVSPEERARAQRYADEVSARLAERQTAERQARAADNAAEKAAAPEPRIIEPPPPVVHAVTPPAPPPPPRFRSTAIVLGAVAVVAGAGGLTASLRVRSLERAVEQAPPASFTAADLANRRRQAHNFELLQWVGYGVGGAALVSSLLFLMVGHDLGDRALGVGSVAGRPALFFSGMF